MEQRDGNELSQGLNQEERRRRRPEGQGSPRKPQRKGKSGTTARGNKTKEQKAVGEHRRTKRAQGTVGSTRQIIAVALI